MTLIPWSYFLFAVGLTTAFIAVFWIVGALAGPRLGFYLNNAAILVVVSGCAFCSYRDLTECLLSSAPAFPQCEWAAPFLWVIWSMTITVLPLLIISTITLRRWSNSPTKLAA